MRLNLRAEIMSFLLIIFFHYPYEKMVMVVWVSRRRTSKRIKDEN
tara:strand:- start:194 stop:328 length:135 start_codon:yes stop_codon:yes gene_type:complete